MEQDREELKHIVLNSVPTDMGQDALREQSIGEIRGLGRFSDELDNHIANITQELEDERRSE